MICPLWGQVAPPAGDDPVVAVIEGKAWKKSELERLVLAQGGDMYQKYSNNKREFLKQFGLMQRLAKMAEAEKIDQQDPHQWRLMYQRTVYLASQKLNMQKAFTQMTPEEEEKYYRDHISEYSAAKVKGILITYDDPKAKKPRTMAQAEEAAKKVAQEARMGSDFEALVAEYSDDEESRSQKGLFPAVKSTDNVIPAPLKTAIFGLKPGQVSEPLKLLAGFWVLKLEEFTAAPFASVRDEVFEAAQMAKFRVWMEALTKDVKVEFKDNTYLDKKMGQQ